MKKSIKIPAIISFIILLASITIISASASTYTPSGKIIHGDVSGDGVINARDVLMARQYMANYNYKTGTSSITVSVAADVSGDAQINALDVLMISKYLANYDYDTDTSTVEFKHAVEAAVAPTCTKWGATAGDVCSICNMSFPQQEFLSPTGHDYINEVCILCGDTKKDYSDISLYKLNESDAFFESIDNLLII